MLPVNRAERERFYSSNPEPSTLVPSKIPSHIRPIPEEKESKKRHIEATDETNKWKLTRGKCQYEGQIVDGLFHGKGTLTTERGDKFTGAWQGGVLLGKITVVTNNAIRMKGDWNEGWQGMVKTRSKTESFEGTFKSGGQNFLEREQGTLIRESTTYMGKWCNNSFVEGTIFYQNHSLYKKFTGKALGGQFHGLGELELINGGIITGEFVQGDCPKGKLSKNNFSYQGELRNFQPHGLGILRTSTETYKGSFHDGEKHGLGTETTHFFAIEGMWEKGKLITTFSKKTLTEDESLQEIVDWLSEY